ncbi:MAG: DUF4097 family beta strand repeat-containing protein [Oscillospiraceae bacterium]|nr:DUF4097 family beta strand repeat-containing protein [Oscillospiraceae bacterium]
MAEKQTYTFNNEIDTVEVSSLGAKIIMIPQEREDIYVEYDNPKDAPEFCAVLSGKTLTLKESFSFKIFGNKPTDGYTISVYLPLKTFENIRINTASGGVEVGEVSAENFTLNTASGNINVNAFLNNVKLQSASGNITLTNPLAAQQDTGFLDKEETAVPTAQSLNVCTVSGNATISGYRTELFGVHSVSGRTVVNGISGRGSVSVTSGSVELNYADWNNDLSVSLISGNVKITLPENSGASLNINGVSGSVRTDLGQAKGSFINLGKGTSGDFGGENRHKLDASLTSGTVTVAQA